MDRKSKVDIGSLKRFALEKLPASSPLRDVLLSEVDELSAYDFITKMHTWLVLSKHKSSNE